MRHGMVEVTPPKINVTWGSIWSGSSADAHVAGLGPTIAKHLGLE